jgi:hypothetical protein
MIASGKPPGNGTKASVALAAATTGTDARASRDDEARIQAAVAQGLVEGILRIAVGVVVVPFAAVLFVFACFAFPVGSSNPYAWAILLAVCFGVRWTSRGYAAAKERWPWIGQAIAATVGVGALLLVVAGTSGVQASPADVLVWGAALLVLVGAAVRRLHTA